MYIVNNPLTYAVHYSLRPNHVDILFIPPPYLHLRQLLRNFPQNFGPIFNVRSITMILEIKIKFNCKEPKLRVQLEDLVQMFSSEIVVETEEIGQRVQCKK